MLAADLHTVAHRTAAQLAGGLIPFAGSTHAAISCIEQLKWNPLGFPSGFVGGVHCFAFSFTLFRASEYMVVLLSTSSFGNTKCLALLITCALTFSSCIYVVTLTTLSVNSRSSIGIILDAPL